MSEDPLIVENGSDGIARIAFNRPDQRNALDSDQWDRLGDALDRLAADGSVRCLIVTGRGRTFASGGDLKTLLAELADEDGPKLFRTRLHRCFEGLTAFPAPTVAAVNGPAIGGGLELTAACDLRIAVPEAKFGMPAARFGMVMARAEFVRLAGIVGVDRARILAITARVFDAAEAQQIGLVHRLVDARELDTAAQSAARELCSSEPEAIAWFRRAALALERGGDLSDLADFEEECLKRPVFRDRVEAFVKR
ncbi:enoyl-CoA hydratase/isomerase family protein [Marivibrio halodurans]|uniref:Enoyl-CoA hydratase/isomerase family protein n=1 Tax=Marivibrio halodurans TaxID=2039722 RepID=A0A8J7SPC0_9PROT|nr:enoyl-CoA hydratase/isomerase family protein [Marivibrio halodurans]MBP5858543.1 enoyl-CoA hydratase/isomerase family protein [Marivibrio halodurans]